MNEMTTSAVKWGFASTQGAREKNEDGAQMFEAHDSSPNFILFVHDGHGGDAAMHHLSTWLENESKDWTVHTAQHGATEATAYMGGLYTRAIEELKNETSGVVSVGALCQSNGVCFAWVGDCEAAVIDPDDGLYRAECTIEDLGETKLLGTTVDPNIMPSFLRLGQRERGPQLQDAATQPHSLLGSTPIACFEVGVGYTNVYLCDL